MIRIKTKEEMVRDNLVEENGRPFRWYASMDYLYGRFFDNYTIDRHSVLVPKKNQEDVVGWTPKFNNTLVVAKELIVQK